MSASKKNYNRVQWHEIIFEAATPVNTQACKTCGREGHSDNAKFCEFRGEKL